jgi:rhodanese-related sulfurtransferase
MKTQPVLKTKPPVVPSAAGYAVLLFLFAGLLFGCNSDPSPIKNPFFRYLLASLLREKNTMTVNEVSQKQYPLLDARTREEFNVSRLPGAQFIGFDTLSVEVLEAFHPDDTLLIYCSIGYRSELVAQQLREQGFKNAFNLYGGIFEWVNQGNLVLNRNGEPTSQVHPYNFWWGLFLSQGDKTKNPL